MTNTHIQLKTVVQDQGGDTSRSLFTYSGRRSRTTDFSRYEGQGVSVCVCDGRNLKFS